MPHVFSGCKKLVIKTARQLLCWITFCCGLLGAGVGGVRADGIALSRDGRTWSQGVGGYGADWGATGRGISVRQGETVYVKFYRDSAGGGPLSFSEHGRAWDDWKTTGPAIASGTGDAAGNPVVLRISKIGTPQSEVLWFNGPRGSGRWTAFTAPGAYDLGLGRGSRWTLPPLVVSERPVERSFWATLFGGRQSASPAESLVATVPDGGVTFALFAAALLSLAAVRRRLM